jgi:hypothetical protein
MDTADTHPHHQHISYVTAELFESPKEIADMRFAVEDETRGKEWLAKLLAEPDHQIVGEFGGVPIHRASNYFFTEKDGRLSYFVRFEEKRFPLTKDRYVTQIAVEADRVTAPTGVASYVFFEYLLPMHGAVMTDNAQTRLGKIFWQRQVKLAIERGDAVFFIDTTNRVARKIFDRQSYDNAARDAYGTLDRHRNLRLLITTKPLPSAFELVEARNTGAISAACAST